MARNRSWVWEHSFRVCHSWSHSSPFAWSSSRSLGSRWTCHSTLFCILCKQSTWICMISRCSLQSRCRQRGDRIWDRHIWADSSTGCCRILERNRNSRWRFSYPPLGSCESRRQTEHRKAWDDTRIFDLENSVQPDLSQWYDPFYHSNTFRQNRKSKKHQWIIVWKSM